MSEISVIVPAYFESENLPELVQRLKNSLREMKFEILVLNDENPDGSLEVIKMLQAQHQEVKLLHSNSRRGKTKAIIDGFNQSRGSIIVIIDADLQYFPEDLPKLIECLDESDVVNGLRNKREDGIGRKIESVIYNRLVQLFFHVAFSDNNSGLKVFKREVLGEIIPELRHRWHRYLLILANRKGFRVIEKPVRHCKRRRGQSKFLFSPLKLFRGFYDLLSIKRTHFK